MVHRSWRLSLLEFEEPGEAEKSLAVHSLQLRARLPIERRSIVQPGLSSSSRLKVWLTESVKVKQGQHTFPAFVGTIFLRCQASCWPITVAVPFPLGEIPKCPLSGVFALLISAGRHNVAIALFPIVKVFLALS
jgi:hypothetical protein